jgi:hypothetical protein
MITRKGSCLCGSRTYEIKGDLDGVWMCHCSLCRKVSGSNGIAILIVPRERFRWLNGADHGITYALRSTYSVTRCATCGSPLPVEEDEKHIYLPAGSLDDPLGAGIGQHIFCGSTADWDFDAEDVKHHDECAGSQCSD